MISNSPEYAVAVLGALQVGAAVTTINPIYTPNEVHSQLVHSDPKVLIGEPETIPVLTDALLVAKKTLPIITVKGSGSAIPSGTICFEELAIADNVDLSVLNEVNVSSDDIGFLPYSSGTTGLPKGVQLLHRNIVANCLQQDVIAVRQYDETTNVAVIGVPHRRMGELPKAFIVLKEGHKADAEEITLFVNKQVADFKRVKEVMFLDALPKNASGKFLRRVLKEKYC